MPLPAGRTAEYTIWRSCERFKMLPPGINFEWDENSSWSQALLLSYNNIREQEEMQLFANSGAAVLSAMKP